ncbi:DUF2075 domain-containing protein [Gammaproteobacteria bacterium]|nr:DUF2075 domain-containing protein [Gammaproteobacteria bacterium]
MSRSYCHRTLQDFLDADPKTILGELTDSESFDINTKTTDAWKGEIKLIQETLEGIQGHIHLEYIIPRMGKRVDVLLVIQNIIFLLEFKVGTDHYDASAINQVIDYALDMQNFHEGSHNQIICPILIATGAEEKTLDLILSNDQIFEPILSNGNNLKQIIQLALSKTTKMTPSINHDDWFAKSYKPTPNIIEAAQALYKGHDVTDISRSDAGATNLTDTSSEIQQIIKRAKEQNEKAICFVTGVPGSGKTLVGLNVATDQSNGIGASGEIVFLSGNGPLVNVLSEALARDHVARSTEDGERISKNDAMRLAKGFIQNIHHFRDDNLETEIAPHDRVVIFDESQRAWSKNKLQTFMKKRGGLKEEFKEMSEPDLLISVMDRHQDWCVIVCLVGGGQEINKGEAGMSTWIKSMETKYKDWKVYVSNEINQSVYSWDYPLDSFLSSYRTTTIKNLHLSVSLRSFRSENLSNFINEVIAGNIEKAQNFKDSLSDYPLRVTRSLPKAKEWLKKEARGSERYGLVAEANAIRLKPDGIFIKSDIDEIHWFLADKDDVRSSYYLEDVATEYDVQGLELDWVCACWDAGLRRIDDEWQMYKFTGTKFTNRNAESERKYLMNAYRVLLTRARQGLIIFVPLGDSEDKTRDPSFYDGTYDYLLNCGFTEV